MKELLRRLRSWLKYGRVFPEHYFQVCPKCGYNKELPGDTCCRCLYTTSPRLLETEDRINRIIASGITNPCDIFATLRAEEEMKRRLH